MSKRKMEDYIKQIYLQIEMKGFARVSDIANILDVKPSSVTKMIQKLDQKELLIYEKYRGIKLTQSGHKFGKYLVYRHNLLESLFRIVGVNEECLCSEVEEIEHHLSPKTLDRIIELVQFFQEDEQRVHALKELQQNNKESNDLL